MDQNVLNAQQMNVERLTPKDLVRKHIADRTHKITEEEFNKLIVGVFSADLSKQKIAAS